MSARFKDFARLGGTLRRVRAADRPLEGGGKKVWHQGEAGTEIISFVDAQGVATRQECYLGGQVVTWQIDKPLSTGALQDEKAIGDTVAPDAQLSSSAVLNAVALLDEAPTEDKYLEHFRAVLRVAAQRLPPTGLDPSEIAALRRVTADLPAVRPEELQPAPARSHRWLLWAALVGVAGAFAAYFATR